MAESCGIRLTASFLSRSVSRLHVSGAGSAIELYKKASRSITSLTKFRDSFKTRVANEQQPQRHSPTKSLDKGSSSSLKCTWPVPWLEAIFLPEFPVKSTITEKDFAILNEIGSGAFGNVFRVCLKREPGVLFAMKVQQKSEVLARNATKQIKDEASIHKSLSFCVFIAKFYASWQSRTQLYTVLQYAMGYGDLFTLWRDYGPFGEETLLVYATEIALAIDYIHENDIVYRDLKLENVVLDLDGHIQLVDFGFAKRLQNGDRTQTICGTLQYMAPEIAKGEPYGKAVDWWSFGVLLHILLTNRYPFPNSDATNHEELTYDDYSTPNCGPLLGDLFNRLEPFAHIEKLRRCPSCNSVYDRSGSEMSGTDIEENWAAFDEHYEFDDVDYFRDRL
ncbi:unnamed protein product [Toxocara canis]|uniref:Protein kinase domain-containing protein n=1 Tax=Toxocara canis TaxID=6265 RepID=A0A183V562_TOXCA|nr:unnamed protein product [Toxocara canis]